MNNIEPGQTNMILDKRPQSNILNFQQSQWKWDTNIKICTWDLLYTEGALQDLWRVLSEYKSEITVLQEKMDLKR